MCALIIYFTYGANETELHMQRVYNLRVNRSAIMAGCTLRGHAWACMLCHRNGHSCGSICVLGVWVCGRESAPSKIELNRFFPHKPHEHQAHRLPSLPLSRPAISVQCPSILHAHRFCCAHRLTGHTNTHTHTYRVFVCIDIRVPSAAAAAAAAREW